MGEIADAIVDGEMCQVCGVFLAGEPAGYPRSCRGCGGDADEGFGEEDEEDLEEATAKLIADLNERGVHVEVKNQGMHWILRFGKNRADYWPTRDKFRMNNQGATRFGFNAMLKEFLG